MGKTIAVITGDVVNSRSIEKKAMLNKVLKESFKAVESKVTKAIRPFEIFRGDSFQGVVEPSVALRSALVLRARMRQWQGPVSFSVAGNTKRQQLGESYIPPFLPTYRLPDVRIAIGIGHPSYRSSKVIESDGEAYQYSGKALDRLATGNDRLLIHTPWPEVDLELSALCKLLDALVSKWSSASAQTMFLYLSTGATQIDISEKLKISQPAVHKRLAGADMDAVNAALERFEELMKYHAA